MKFRTSFICFEGIEGAGKTTAINELKNQLEAGEGDVKVWAGRIEFPDRKSGKMRDTHEVTAYIDLLGDQMDRLQEEGYDIVLLDRSILSLLSYHAFYERTVSPETILYAIQKRGNILGRLNIFVFDTPVNVCYDRLKGQRELGYLRQFAATVDKAVEFIRPYAKNRLQRFSDSGDAIKYGYDLLFKPIHADISITDHCPLHCPFCVFRASERRSALQMEVEQVHRIVDRCFDAGIEEIHLFGGEPLVWGQRLVELVEYIKGRGGRCHLLTSGFSVKFMPQLVDLVDAVFVSLDGPEETHARTRGLSSVFPNAIKWLQAIQTAGKKPRIGTAVACINYDTAHLVPLVLLENKIHPTNVCFFHATPSGGDFVLDGREHFDRFLSPFEWLEFQKRLKTLYAGDEWSWVHSQVSFSKKPEFAGCFLEQRRRWLSIMTNGDMYPCPNWVCASPVANILQDDPITAIETTLSGAYLPQDGGKGCWDRCLGGCPAFAIGCGDGTCDGRCGRVSGRLPESLRISPELLAEGYFPVCPNREVQIRNL